MKDTNIGLVEIDKDFFKKIILAVFQFCLYLIFDVFYIQVINILILHFVLSITEG